MKKLLILISTGITLLMSSCIKNDLATFTAAQIEWDAASWNANSTGLTYPMMTRVPIYGFATGTSAPLINRTTGTIRLRVNVVGAQAATDRAFTFKFNQAESTGAPGTHFQAVTGTGTIPANSSFGFVDFVVLNPGAGTGTATAVLELTENAVFKPATNYAKIGLSIAQP
jgi:hypothetical protein